MFYSFEDINGSQIILSSSAIWGVTIPVNPEAPAEILLIGADKSVKIPRETAPLLLGHLQVTKLA